MTKPNSTFIGIILDKSGSMGHVRYPTLEGINSFLAKQKELPGEARVSLVQFSSPLSAMINSFSNLPIKSVPVISPEMYVPEGGTALLDAIGITIDNIGRDLALMPEAERPSNVLVIIMTDGEENSSDSYNRERIFQMIKHQREVYNWEFIFMGANQDAIAAGDSLSISTRNSMTYNANSVKGIQAAYHSLTASATRYRSGETVAFTAQERAENAPDTQSFSLP